MTSEEKTNQIQIIYELSTKFGRFVQNVENWSEEDIDHEVTELEELLAAEDNVQ